MSIPRRASLDLCPRTHGCVFQPRDYGKIAGICFYFRCQRCCVCSVHRGQKRASEVPNLELPAVVSHHVGAENSTPALCISSECFLLWNHFSGPYSTHLNRHSHLFSNNTKKKICFSHELIKDEKINLLCIKKIKA